LHKLVTTFVLGYHGCDRDVAERLLAGTPFTASQNDWDWLGHGVYFWEANPLRGLEFARMLQDWRKRTGKGPEIKDPYVVGAVIDLGRCLDLFSSSGTRAVAGAYPDFLQYCAIAGQDVPQNSGGPYRYLDCAVINHLHAVLKSGSLPAFDSVKGPFIEGKPIYPNSSFYEKTHIQICVRNLECIKGVFRVPDDQLSP
jgi:hypothetical protein